MAKFTPSASAVAPRGCSRPGQTVSPITTKAIHAAPTRRLGTRPARALGGAARVRLCSCSTPREERAIATRFATRRVHDPRSALPPDDSVAVEEPLEIRVAGDAVAITMRTP